MRLHRRRPDLFSLHTPHLPIRTDHLDHTDPGILQMLGDPSAVRVGAFDADPSDKAERGDVRGDRLVAFQGCRESRVA